MSHTDVYTYLKVAYRYSIVYTDININVVGIGKLGDNMSRTDKKYSWQNFASVEMLSQMWNVSKRHTQRILAKLLDENKAEIVIGVYYDPRNPFARPFYRKVK